jgi:4-alpha-glucanotransferase
MESLAKHAAEWGVAAEYVDASGVLRRIDAQTLKRVIDIVSNGEPRVSRHLLPPTIVARRGRPQRLPIDGLPRDASIEWVIVSGEERIAAGTDRNGAVHLPDDLPIGEYRLSIAAKSEKLQLTETSIFLVAPERAFGGGDPAGRMWGLAVQLYGIRSERNWGHGDFSDLSSLLDLAAEIGAAGIGVNPLHALFPDDPEQASPYSPNSRLFLNPLYIDLEAVPDFPGTGPAGLTEAVGRLRQATLVDYEGVAAAKLAALRLAFANFRKFCSAKRKEDFSAFRAEHGAALVRFASFEVLRQKFGNEWRRWPAGWQDADLNALERLRRSDADELEFQEYVQWIADRQLRGCRDKAHQLQLPLGLYLDIAVGVDPNGADAWSERAAMLANVSIGAPPDPLNTAGQNWGIVSFNPRALERHGFGAFRRMLAAAMRYAGAVRLDHVLGLYRLYLIPEGARAGAYVRCPVEALLAVVAQESVRYRCVLVGEDLGTVPEDLRGMLADWGVWSYRVLLFERHANGWFRQPQDYPREALVTFSTHDLATFAGWASGADLHEKRALGMDPGETDAERADARLALRDAIRVHESNASADLSFVSVTRYLADTPAKLLMVSIEDALGILEQTNVPGTIDEHPNWRRRIPIALERLASDPRIRAVAEVLAQAGRGARAVQR